MIDLRFLRLATGIAGLVVILTGCETAAMSQSKQMSAAWQAANAATAQCFGQVRAEARFAPLNSRFLTSGQEPSLAAQADETKATDAEVQLLFERHAATQRCRTMMLEGAAKVHPAFVTAVSEYYLSADDAYLKAARRQFTWGEFLRRQKTDQTQIVARIASIASEIDRNLANAHQYEMQQRQQAANSLAMWFAYQQQLNQQQQMINAMNRPRFTNCNYIGRNLHCVTQ